MTIAESCLIGTTAGHGMPMVETQNCLSDQGRSWCSELGSVKHSGSGGNSLITVDREV